MYIYNIFLKSNGPSSFVYFTVIVILYSHGLEVGKVNIKTLYCRVPYERIRNNSLREMTCKIYKPVPAIVALKCLSQNISQR